MSAQVSSSRRMVGYRYRRIWALVETIAAEPGHSRRELADRFFLSDRQLQDDLTRIRDELGLPLVRCGGYRFADEGAGGGVGSPSLQEAQLLVLVLALAWRERAVPREPLERLTAKLPGMFPPHLRPLVGETLKAVLAPRSKPEGRIFTALADAIVHGSWVQLHRLPMALPLLDCAEPVVKPEILLPYLGGWYLLAETGADGVSRMFDLATLTEVTVSPEVPHPNGSRR
jgi:hypothetical protein